MWILSPVEHGGEIHYLLSNKEYVVGRKNCDILLSSDQSISRVHAHLIVTDQTLTLRDTSKYGTTINSQPLAENTAVTLKSGDSITFGVFQSKFSVDHLKPVVCSSCLDNDGKAALSQALQLFGGKLVSLWTQDCTHLVMPSVKVTIKTISALLCCCPIVKPGFFTEFNTAAQQKLPPPKAERFIPDIDEPSLINEDLNLEPDLRRKWLFAGTTFIFLTSKQLKRLGAAVSFGGGTSRLLEEGSLPRDLLESPQSCLVDFTAGNSQPSLPASTTEWHNSVRNIVQRKGFRVITECEIGLAAMYTSRDIYCNPSSLIKATVTKTTSRIPSASLSQHVVVDETVLPAASQNITAYAVNTETSHITERCTVSGITAVGETQERRQNQKTALTNGPKAATQKMNTQCIVADSPRSSFSTTESTHSKRKKPESKVAGQDVNIATFQPPLVKSTGGKKTFEPKKFPQKQHISPQASPQKQARMTSFFKPVNKKRPLDEELSVVMSEPKCPVLESDIIVQAADTFVASVDAPSCSDKAPGAPSQMPMDSENDLFISRAAASSHMKRKRKELEEEIDMVELESIMSEDMDCLDESFSVSESPQARANCSERMSKNEEALSKKQRVACENDEDTRSQRSPVEELFPYQRHQSDHKVIPPTTEKLHPSAERMSSKVSSGSTSQHVETNRESSTEELGHFKGDDVQPQEATAVHLMKPVDMKQETQNTKLDEDLPKKLILVEFRSLTVNLLHKTKPQQMHTNGFVKNFKRFCKMRVPATENSAHIIGGADLLAHNRGKNSELDEWLKDAEEDERQSRLEESEGDNLFRYNPTKLTKKR
ncbi:nibrin isoform X2 [Phyllopteryx taeniolatus]|uniref:nibrin isoform X2 n=1 Tax=Phyllopteryx taeniolatus TaxID=161469 RepID=UPI002AD4747D|nr:nibrin isoform X2 [Phyllopteryx taeniolatus]